LRCLDTSSATIAAVGPMFLLDISNHGRKRSPGATNGAADLQRDVGQRRDRSRGGHLAEAQHHPAENPGGVLAAAARALVVRELFLHEAWRLGLEARPDREMAVPSATEAECRRFYEKNPQRFASEPIFEPRHILLAASPKDKPA